MKPTTVLLTFIFLIASNMLSAQKNAIPQVDLLSLEGKTVNSLDVFDGTNPAIVVFWKISDQYSQDHLDEMIIAHNEILADKNVRLIGICIDGNGSTAQIRPFVSGNGWEIEMYIDRNGELKRLMNILDTPATMVFNTGNEVICQFNGYCTGTENMICAKLNDCLEKTHQKESFAFAK